MTFGTMLRGARTRARLTLRDVADALGVSHVFVHEVERDWKPLATRHWPALVARIPTLTLRGLAEARAQTGTVKLDAAKLTAEQRAAIVEALVAEAGEVS